jgi:hypothetical protein
VSADRCRNEDSRPRGGAELEGLRGRVGLAEDHDAKRHSRNGANELRDNPAGERNPGRANLVAFSRFSGDNNSFHKVTFAGH